MRGQREASRSSGAPGRGRVILWVRRDHAGSSRQGKVRQRAVSADGTRGLGLEMEAVLFWSLVRQHLLRKVETPYKCKGIRNRAGRE